MCSAIKNVQSSRPARSIFGRCNAPAISQLLKKAGRSGESTARSLEIARINWDGDQLTITQVIEVARTPCPFGGHRPWFWCSCDRHVLTFYSPNGRPWACRHCHDLTYATRQPIPRHRQVLRARRIRERLGGSINLLEDFPPKPKGMHWRRYHRMREVHDRAYERTWARDGYLIRRPSENSWSEP